MLCPVVSFRFALWHVKASAHDHLDVLCDTWAHCTVAGCQVVNHNGNVNTRQAGVKVQERGGGAFLKKES